MSFIKENSFGPSNDMEVDDIFENGNNISFEDHMNMDNIIPSNINSKNIEYNDSVIFLEQDALHNNQELFDSNDYLNKNNNPNPINLFNKSSAKFDSGFFSSNNFAFLNSNLNNIENTNKYNSTNQITVLKKQLILEQIKYKISSIFNIIQKHLEILKYKSFLDLKDYLKKRKLNILRAESIFNKFHSLMLNVSKIYVKFQKIKFSKSFFKWKNQAYFRKKYNQLKLDIEKNSEKKYEKELKSLEERVKEREEEKGEAKKTLQKNSEIEAGILKTISEFEEKENNYIKAIKKLEEEKKAIQEEIESIILESAKSQSLLKNINYTLIGNKGDAFHDKNNNSNFLSNNTSEFLQKFSSDNSGNNPNANNNVNYIGNESSNFAIKKDYLQKLHEKIQEKENKIIKLRQENSEKDKRINVFMNEMAELIQAHENNIDIVLNLGNVNQNYSVNYNNIENFSLEENKSNINSLAKSTSKPTINLNQTPALSAKLVYSSNNPLNKSNGKNLFNSGAILNSLANQPHSVRNSNTKSSNTRLGYFPNYSTTSNNNNNNNDNFNSEFNIDSNQNKTGGLNSKIVNYSNSLIHNNTEAFSGYNTNASTTKQMNSFGLNKSNSNFNSNVKDGLNSNSNNAVYNARIMRK